MSRRIQRLSWVLLAATLIGVLGMIAVPWFLANAREASRIRVRYAAMRVALSAGDTNAALALLAPEYRGGGHRSFGALGNFAQPLGPSSRIRMASERATIWPDRIYHYRLIPGGHSIEMVKRDGDWYFTGKVHVD